MLSIVRESAAKRFMGASLSRKAVDFDSTIRRFESSRPSQPVRRSEKMSPILAEMPANGGLLRTSRQSLGSDFGHSRSEIANSLRRTFEKLPFLGDCGRRPGSICTARPSLQCNSPNSPPWPPASWECRARTAAPVRREAQSYPPTIKHKP